MAKGFYVLKDESEFDRFLGALLSTLGTAMMQENNFEKKDVDELMDLTMHNIMFLCAEYHGLVDEGKMEPVEKPKDKTKTQLREEVMKQLEVVEKFFNMKGEDKNERSDAE